MKNRIVWKPSLSLALLILPLASSCARQAPLPPTTLATREPAVPYGAETTPAADAGAAESAAEAAPAPDIAAAAAVPVSAENPVPPNVRTAGPVADIIKLASASVEPSVLLAFVTNSTSLFNLTAEEIIYLKDLGIQNGIIAAVLQHDQALKESLAGAPAMPAPAPPPFAPLPAGAPVAPLPAFPAPDMAPGEPAVESYPPPPPEVADDAFYDSLAPYGTWIDVDGYGRCWRPSVCVVNPTWQPYFDGGHWLYTDCGWYWTSDYSWGWAPFHYGRWFRHDHWGWCWMPDLVWGPSWTCWRFTDGYCGWAPLPPGAIYRPGVGLLFYGRRVGLDFSFNLGIGCFSFVSWGHFHEHHLRAYAVPHEYASRIYQESRVAVSFQGNGHTIVNCGLSAEHVAAATHTAIRPVTIREVRAPAGAGVRTDRLASDGRTLNISRPRVLEPASRTIGTTARQPAGAATLGTGRSAENRFRVPPAVSQPGAAASETPRTTYQAPAQRQPVSPPAYQAPPQREYNPPAYQPPREVPRYNAPPAERPRVEPAPAYSPPRPPPAPAPSAPPPAPPRSDRK